MSMPDQLLSRFREALIMDNEWSVQTTGSVTWWGGPQPLVLTSSDVVDIAGDASVKVTAYVDLFENAPDSRELAALINLRNTIASTGALVFDPERSTVTMFCAYYAHAGNEPITVKFPAFALMMYTEALALAQLPELTDICGSAATPAHPETGVRSDFDELIGFTDTQIVPAGQEPTRWTEADGDELAALLSDAGRPPERDEASLSIQLPFLDAPPDEAQSFLILEPRAEHPNYGSGLLSLVRLPAALPTDLAIQIGMVLNYVEFRTFDPNGRAVSGAWCAMPIDADPPTSYIAHDLFLPNYFYGSGWTTYLGALGSQRAAWAAEEVASILETMSSDEGPTPDGQAQ